MRKGKKLSFLIFSRYIQTRILTPAIAFIFFIFLWELTVQNFSISPLVLPAPSAVLKVLVERFGYLAFHAGITFLEAVLGFLLGSIAGFALATLFLFSRTAEQAIYPYAVAIKAIPLVALAPLVVAWFGSGLFSKVFLAAIITFFPVLVNSLDGFKSVESDALDLFHVWSASQWQIFIKFRVFHALPSLFAGLKVSSSFAIVGAVVAEFIGSEQGIGFAIKSSSYFLSTDLTFAAILVSALIGLAFFWLISALERKIVFWKNEL
ncbi:ABC transporter permease [Oscillatoriales cyanobacterium LEGE 11467]|uniref:ABC transporter permease n=1 Tax=Zarconia navalis LEGE 11467 TaxID=1828826 RepID=A0A928VX36_9CYAN|nr:ABC transporter permease [Zarconia navalis]MBE9039395.1 ABC transporter permease [Zarconia navalis LEGE 11467]